MLDCRVAKIYPDFRVILKPRKSGSRKFDLRGDEHATIPRDLNCTVDSVQILTCSGGFDKDLIEEMRCAVIQYAESAFFYCTDHRFGGNSTRL